MKINSINNNYAIQAAFAGRVNKKNIKKQQTTSKESFIFPGKNVIDLPVRMSERAAKVIKEDDISMSSLVTQAELTRYRYFVNSQNGIKNDNVAASIMANGKMFFSQRTNFSNSYHTDPIEVAAAKAIEDIGDKTEIKSICYLADEGKKGSLLIRDRYLDPNLIGELSRNYASPKTLLIRVDEEGFHIDTISDLCLPAEFGVRSPY